LSPLLSIGSGAGRFRDGKQPWIEEQIYRPLEARGVEVKHHEFAPADGVDIAGDLHDDAFLAGLAEMEFSSVMCCNVLEHLEPRATLTGWLPKLVAPGGYAILTVPHKFPYHADPIDTLFRPSVDDLARDLPDLDLLRGEEVRCGTLFRYLLDAPDARESLTKGIKTSLARIGRRSPAAAASTPSAPGSGALGYLVRQTEITCAIFRRPQSD
jgi:hypothetical protein